jgi:hypothetical protein
MAAKQKGCALPALISIAFVVTAVLWLFALNRKTPQPRPTDLEVVSASGLWAIYEHNEIKADSLFRDKFFAVAGPIIKIGKGIEGSPYVAIETGDPIFVVQCLFSEKAEKMLAKLHPGMSVTVAGTGSGKFGNVLLRDCWFYSPEGGK